MGIHISQVPLGSFLISLLFFSVFALKMASSLRNVDWAGVWNLCQEEKRHRRERRPERVDGKAAQQMPAGASSKEGEEEEGAVPSSYHQLTPKKKTPQARDGVSRIHEWKTVPSRHQAKPESNHENHQVLRNAEETQETQEREGSSSTRKPLQTHQRLA